MADKTPDEIFEEARAANSASPDADAIFEQALAAKSDPKQVAKAGPGQHKAGIPESMVRGFGQGGSLGFGDEISGAMGALQEFTGHYNPLAKEGAIYPELGIIEASKKRYALERDAMRKEDMLARTENPKSYLGGQLSGALATTLATGGASAPAAGAGLLARTAVAGATGALSGGASGLGYSDADLTQGDYSDAAADTAKSAGIGLALGAGGQLAQGAVADPLKKLIQSLIQKYGPAAPKVVQQATQAAGSTLQDSPKALAAASSVAPGLMDRAKDFLAGSSAGALGAGAGGAALGAWDSIKKGSDPIEGAIEGAKHGAMWGAGAPLAMRAIDGAVAATSIAGPNIAGVLANRSPKSKDVAERALSSLDTSSPDSREISQLLQHIASSKDPETSMASFRFINPKLNKFLMDRENEEAESR